MFYINEKKLDQPYEEVKVNYYNYKGLKNLDNTHKININSNNFFICIYQINDSYLYPFLEFLLYNDNDKLIFPKLFLPDNLRNFMIFTYKSINNLLNIDKENNENIDYKGSLYYENNTYLFFDITKVNMKLNCIYKNSPIWFALIHEIMNQKHVCNINIHPDIRNFFSKNSDFLFLIDKNNKNYEIPWVVYTGKDESKISFTYIFGVSKPDKNEILGPYYYFTNFKNAIKQGGYNDKNVKNIKGGIIRFALFTGLMKVKLNSLDDSIDESLIKRELIQNISDNYENLTLRITDYDGKWAEKHDSVYIGNLELDNGEKMKETSVYVVKTYEQQVPLTYHYIDTNLLDDTFISNKNYTIL